MDCQNGNTSANTEKMLANALRWGLPVAPLVVIALEVVNWTLAPAPRERSYLLYATCMLGVLAGLLGVVLLHRLPARQRSFGSLVAMAVLEVAWGFLTMGRHEGLLAMTAAGAALASVCACVLGCLWLLEATDGPRPAIAGYAVALLAGFILYTLVTVAPGSGWSSFALPILTGVPLALRLRGPKDADLDAEDREEERAPWGRWVAAAAPELFMVGGCLGVLGFEASQADASIVVSGVALGCALLLRGDCGKAAARMGAVFMVSGLCASLTSLRVVALALFLGGCACVFAWLIVGGPRPSAPLRPKELGMALGAADGAVLAGLSTVYLLVGSGVLAGESATLILVVGIVSADAVRSLIGGELRDAPTVPASDLLAAASLAALGERYGLSQRELEVAELVCQSRGVQFMSQKLGVAPSTVKSHVQHVYAKTGVHSRDELQVLVEGLAAGRSCEGAAE